MRTRRRKGAKADAKESEMDFYEFRGRGDSHVDPTVEIANAVIGAAIESIESWDRLVGAELS